MPTLSINEMSAPSSPWLSPWPAEELESIAVCPVCGSPERKVLYEGLIDNVFFVAPGLWTMQRCTQCQSAYLGTRPNAASIGKAYTAYFTHVAGPDSVQENAENIGTFRRLRRMLVNGYLNGRYGTRRLPASILGLWLLKCLPVSQRQEFDFQFRYLPKPLQGQRLLDVGCGNGDFLVGVQEAGWKVLGLEPDTNAAATARKRGIDVIDGLIDALADQSGCFDAITLSHVIEHVHEPRELLCSVHRLLKPGGTVYIETPNIQSNGAQVFGKNWRGIETPRHLVLFTPNSLSDLLTEFGFIGIKMERHPGVQKSMYTRSLRMAAGHPPYSSEPVKWGWLDRAKFTFSSRKIAHREFITLTAQKSDS
jgi:2-polyprenyl-3-methyl-5-hydroxy-6-metoxy-1,4-benzoquinol methylase